MGDYVTLMVGLSVAIGVSFIVGITKERNILTCVTKRISMKRYVSLQNLPTHELEVLSFFL